MAIRPIDLQIMIPRVNEVSRIQTDEQQRNLAAQQNKVQTGEKQADESMHQVNSRDEAQKTVIQEQNQKEKRESKQKNKGKHSKENEQEEKEPEAQPSHRTIDIRL